jgi:hypothetical protein
MRRAWLMISLGVAVAACTPDACTPDPTSTTTASPAATSTAPSRSLRPAAALSEADRRDFYHLSEGSELVPLAFLFALKRPGTDQSLYDSLTDFGLLDDPAFATAPSGSFKPRIGETVARPCDLGGQVTLGFNCAACHVGRVELDGWSMIIVGAPSTFDVKGFVGALTDALVPITLNSVAFTEFAWNYGKVQVERRALLARAQQAAGEVVGPCKVFNKAIDHDGAKLHASLDKATVAVLLASSNKGAGPPSAAKQAFAERIDAILAEERAASELAAADPTKAPPLELPVVNEGDLKSALGNKIYALGDQDRDKFLSGLEGFDKSTDLKTTKAFRLKSFETLMNIRLTARSLLARLRLAVRELRSHGTPAGPGRVDAFGTAINVIFNRDDELIAPVDFPHLWGFSKVKRLHWDGNTDSIVERNIGQAIGTGAPLIEGNHSMVHLANLVRLEDIARRLNPPRWSEDLLGPIDHAKAARGENAYKKADCGRCHGEPEGYVEKSAGEAQTDKGRRLLFAREQLEPEGGIKRERAVVLGNRLKAVKEQAMLDTPSWAGLREEFERMPSTWQASSRYTARTLAGIWASAPYLHNGSVRSLRELLLPPEKRSQEPFCRGVREYDLEAVGFRTDVDCAFKLDPTKEGNSNAGHDYTLALSNAERDELLEYLKTL